LVYGLEKAHLTSLRILLCETLRSWHES